jgi:integrase
MTTRPTVPSYRLHKQSGQAVVTLPDGLGGRRDVLLGRHGSAESRAEYARVLAEWEAAGRRPPRTARSTHDLSVNELILAFWRHAEQHYRDPDGAPTTELGEYRRSFRPLRELYGHTPAANFGPLALKAIRESLTGSCCRGVVNQRVGRLKRLFKWAVEQELVPPSVYHDLQAVRGLTKGRSAARETEPVGPVSPAVVAATLPFLNRHVAAMVRVQLLTGARPGEVAVMRGADIDMTGKVWLYRPRRHKTRHHGHGRFIALGPQAQQVVRPFLKLNTEAFLFSPAEAVAELRAGRRMARKTKVQPSQHNRRKAKPKRSPGGRYTAEAYCHSVYAACDKAFPPPAPLAKLPGETEKGRLARLSPEEREELARWRSARRWHPHQLRHTKATEIRREFGLDAARAVLGHRTPAVTEVYAEVDMEKAAEVMERLG